jgi:hypothetical protein
MSGLPAAIAAVKFPMGLCLRKGGSPGLVQFDHFRKIERSKQEGASARPGEATVCFFVYGIYLALPRRQEQIQNLNATLSYRGRSLRGQRALCGRVCPGVFTPGLA